MILPMTRLIACTNLAEQVSPPIEQT